MYSRDDISRLLAVVAAAERRDNRWLLSVSMGGGIVQLALLYWADRALSHRLALSLEGGVFLVYLGLVVWLIWRRRIRQTAAAPRCPSCGAALQDVSLRIAMATGKCDRCGAPVIAE